MLHEIPALSNKVLAFAERLSAQGFTVYVPVLFGNTKGKTSNLHNLATIAELGTSPNWNVVFGQHQHSPITDWLRLLCRDISAAHNNAGMGVIGMCLTGAFPVALMSEKCVVAPVECQPSLLIVAITPEGRRSLAISQRELSQAITGSRERDIDVFATRYGLDRIAKREKFKTLHDAFGDRFLDHTIPRSEYPKHRLKRNSHATLTHCVDTPPARQLFGEVVAFLHSKL